VPQGKVKWFSTEKAFGFIEQENDNDIFVHVTGLADGVTAIDKDMLVEYEVEQGRKGPQATNVRPASAPAATAAPAAEEAEVVEVVEEVEVVEIVEIEDEAGDVEIVEIVEIDEEVVVEAEEEEEA
jgi:CspA family cold shock protein